MSEKIKIAYLDYSHVFAGAERVLYTIIENIDRGRYEPVLVFPYPQPHQQLYAQLGCEMVYLADGKKWWMGSERWAHPLKGTDLMARTIWGTRLAMALRRREVSILHVNLLRPDSLMWVLPAKKAGIKVIGHFRSQALGWVPPRAVQRNCDLVLCVSKYSRSRFLTKGEFVESMHIYDSIDIDSFTTDTTRAEAREVFGLPQDAFVISSIGQLSRHKGHDNAIHAFAAIASRYPRAVLFVAGGGVDLEYLHGIADSYPDVRGRIMFTDRQVPNVRDVYRASDLILSLTKVGEAFGLVPYEAAIMGVPFIAPDRGAVLEFVTDGDNGMLVRTEDPAAISSRIEWAINHPSECRAMVGKCRDVVRRSLTPATMVANLDKVYSRLTER